MGGGPRALSGTRIRVTGTMETGTSPPAAALIVHYRTYPDLDRCLAALEQHEPSLDVVVVDYESEHEQLQQVCGGRPHVRVVACAGNHGFAAGVNLAANEAAAAPYFLILNPDTTLEAPLGAHLRAAFEPGSDIGVVGPLIRETDGGIQASARRFPGFSTVLGGRSTWLTRHAPGNPFSAGNLLTGPEVTRPISADWVSGACMAVRREAFAAVGGFDEGFFMYWEDADFCRRALLAGWRTLYDPTISVRHLTGRASRRSPGQMQRAFHRSVFRYYLKHGGPWAWAGAPLVWPTLQLRLAVKLWAARRPSA